MRESSGGEHVKEVKILTKILKANDMIAAENRILFDSQEICCLNLMSSPGAGKTTLLERTAKALSGSLSLAAIEGDIATALDGERLNAAGIPTVQVNTGGGCHLDAGMIKNASQDLNLERTDILFIENVGNLICPSSFDLGEHVRVVLLSIPEGEDKPLKYPGMFVNCDVAILSKVDLLGKCSFDISTGKENLLKVNPKLKVFEVSSTEGSGMEEWIEFLRKLVKEKKDRAH
jgi:hydrogenase nickel incorporation protein HypB